MTSRKRGGGVGTRLDALRELLAHLERMADDSGLSEQLSDRVRMHTGYEDDGAFYARRHVERALRHEERRRVIELLRAARVQA